MQNQLPDLKLGRYRHYKGKEYEVVGIGTNTETREILVVYKCRYDTPGYDRDALWMRPYDMFVETVTVDSKEVPRFEYISNEPGQYAPSFQRRLESSNNQPQG